MHTLVQQQLLAANGLADADFARALGLIGAHAVDYADIYCQRTAYESWHLEESMVKSGNFHIEQGVGVRAVSGDKTAFAYAGSLDAQALTDAAAAVRAIGRAAQERTVALRPGRAVTAQYGSDNPIASLDAAAKVALLQKIEALAKAADPRIVQVMAGPPWGSSSGRR